MEIFKPIFFSLLLLTLLFSCEPEEENKKDNQQPEEGEIIVFGYLSQRMLLAGDSNTTRYKFSSRKFEDTVQIKIQDGDREKFNLISASGINLRDITANDTFLIQENEGLIEYKGILTKKDFYLRKIEKSSDSIIVTEFSSEPILKTVISDTLSVDPLPEELFANELVQVTGKNLNENLKLFVDGKEIDYTLKSDTGFEFTMPAESISKVYKIEIFIDDNLILMTLQGSTTEEEIIVSGYSSVSVLLSEDSNTTRYKFSSRNFEDTVQIKFRGTDQEKLSLTSASGINLSDITANDTFMIQGNEGLIEYKGIVTEENFYLKKIEEKPGKIVITEFSSEPILKTVISDTLFLDPLPEELYANELVQVTGKNLNDNLKLFVDGDEISYTLKSDTGLEFIIPDVSISGIYKIEFLIDENPILTTLQASTTPNQKYTGKFSLYGYLIRTREPWPNTTNDSRLLDVTASSDTLSIEKDPNDQQKVVIKTVDFDIGSVVVNDSFYVELRTELDLTQVWGVIREDLSYVKFKKYYRGLSRVWEYTTIPDQLPYTTVPGMRIRTFAANLYPGKKFKVTGDNLVPDVEASINGISLKKEYSGVSEMYFEGPDLPVNEDYVIQFKLYGVELLKKQVVLTEENPSDARLERQPVASVLEFHPSHIVNFSLGGKPFIFVNKNLYEIDESDYSLIHKSTFDLEIYIHESRSYASFEFGSSGYILNGLRTHRYDVETNGWTILNNLPFANIRGSFVIGDKAYVISDYVWEYTPEDDSWKQLSQPPEARQSTYAEFSFSLNGNGYFGNILTNIFYRYDPSTDSWERLPDFNFGNTGKSGPNYIGQNFRQSIVFENKVYLFSAKRNEVLSFDGTNWAKAFDFYTFHRSGMILFEQNNRLYFGQGNTRIYNEFFFYDDFWEFTP